jgi:hypothetical protein
MSEFSKLSINSLFGDHPELFQSSGCLDIKSLFLDNKINKDGFNYKILLKDINNKKEKIKRIYELWRNECFRIIRDMQDNGVTDIFFSVPEIIPECNNYNSETCLLFVKSELNKQFIDSKIVTPTQLFVTWKNIESRVAAYEEK